MKTELPNDADGDALRRLTRDGSDLSQEMEIDFTVDVPDLQTGLAFAAIAAPYGFRTDVDQVESGDWTCYCSRTMIPLYEEIISIQALLNRIGRNFNAECDGWGSFGNAQT